MMLQVNVTGKAYWVPPYMVKYRFSGKLPAVCRNLAMGSNTMKVGATRGLGESCPKTGRKVMLRTSALVALGAALLLSTSTADAGPVRRQRLSPPRPRHRRVEAGRGLQRCGQEPSARAISIMRTRGQGFVPSPELHAYAQA